MAEHAVTLIDGAASTSGDLIDVVDPFTGRSIGSTHESGPASVDHAVRSAAQAFDEWSRVPVDERAAVLERAAQLVDEHSTTIASTVTGEMGMPIGLSTVTQARLPATVLRSAAATARSFPWVEDIAGARLRRRPSGVVAAITPWNMPVHQIVAKVSAALAAGCSVVLKPSEATPFDAVLIARIFLDAGVPPGAFDVVQGTGAVTGSALAAHPGVTHVSFTGSVAAGRTVATLAAGALSRTTLELGGKSPAVLLRGADLDVAVTGALGSALVNSGQACNAPTRLVIPAELAGEIEERIAEVTYVLGDPSDPATTHGPLASKRQLDRVVDYAQSALADGGRLVVGTGKPESGCFVAPTVIADLPATARAVREEIFGPVVVLQTYRDADEAIQLANDSDFGLSAEVWGETSDAESVATKLHVGQVKVNGVKTRDRPAVPFGGVKQSGYGRELGALGLSEFTDVTAVMS
ncbi:aldehyde dehydrogenase family protein [Rhodococcoides fascians]|uniref:aldehyde dehydrogenase family protein n=1 Tax=Rhodococcoides fascians TaxID=1828 RepID=UPI001FC9EF64|nr:aldehyde dehydrogenase family protein [Rhodococcus fascians]